VPFGLFIEVVPHGGRATGVVSLAICPGAQPKGQRAPGRGMGRDGEGEGEARGRLRELSA
jgi:hypothetical protein